MSEKHDYVPSAQAVPPYEAQGNAPQQGFAPQQQEHIQPYNVAPTPQTQQQQPAMQTPGNYAPTEQKSTAAPTPSNTAPVAAAAPGGQTYQSSVPLSTLTRMPAPVDCPMCHVRAMTKTEAHVGNTVHAWAFAMCFFFCLGCIPYCISSLKDVEHRCSHCGVMLAVWHRSGRTDVTAHA